MFRYMVFRTSDYKMCHLINLEIAESNVIHRVIALYRRDDLDIFCLGLENIIVTTVMAVADQFFGMAVTFRRCIYGRQKRM